MSPRPTTSLPLYAELFERATATATGSSAKATDTNGCVICDDDPKCPDCPNGEQCVLTIQTCSECPVTYCKSDGSTSSSSGKTNIGGIVGGTVAGVVVLAILMFLFYKFYYQKKVAFNRVRQHKEFFFDDDAEINFHHNRMADLEKPSQRTSLATTVLTRASNIIPIAYIPGVTIGTGSRNQGSSSSRMSTVSESGTVSSEFVGDRYSKASIVGNPALTTTAIRAKPKLVTVAEVKPGSGSQVTHDGVPGTAVGPQQLGGVRSVQVVKAKNQIPLADDFIIEEDGEEDEDDDAQSVVMKNDEDTVLTMKSDYEPFIIDDSGELSDDDDDIDNDNQQSVELGTTRSRESNGSVLLEVEIDDRSPFEDVNEDHRS
ncbi:CYFA0S01e16446g1_1 [Cyberlindnera fabianii]|uniref:CYFA0S01e16446g1_1 n=1 Tax=Cyberlindnera fabianii TaxID=36022 RepID=A0A061ASQ1_CYBFA|nr:Protein OPY2 [Cyberlindnera fabianii]CDR37754.1 CYFA0S01e16446g1_1 [Cyberlindnera fabianii]